MAKADRVHSTPPLNTSAVSTGARGAVQLSPSSMIPARRPDACQASPDPIEPQQVQSTSTSRAGQAVLSRRSLMNMMVSAGAITVAAPGAQASGVSPDAELIELAQQLMDRLPDHKASIKRSDELWAEFDARQPSRSDVLRWRIGDDVGYEMEGLTNDKCRLWCDRGEIYSLRGVCQYDWCLPEHNQAAFDALPEDDQLRHLGAPKPHVQHLFSKKPSKRKQNRINKLIAALDEYDAACEALKLELGIPDAEDLVEELWEPITDIVERMNAIEPTTLAGFQAKAKLLFHYYWDEDESRDFKTVVELVKGLVVAPLAA